MDAKPEQRAEVGGVGGSCTERRGVVISMTGGVEGAERQVLRLIVPMVLETSTHLIQFQYVTKIYSLGSTIFMRSYTVEHYISSFGGNWYSVVHFTHQAVHDTYVEKIGKP